MPETTQLTKSKIRAALDMAGLSSAEFEDLAIEDIDIEDESDAAALDETWAAAQRS
jgi:hypothetical protein